MKIRSLWREPLLHFLLIGLLLFLLYGKVAPPSDDGNRITVTQAGIAALASQFQATWSRPPTPAELQGLVDSHVRDEILFREGAALGLLEDDPVIKRRVRQKLEVLVEEEGKSGTCRAMPSWRPTWRRTRRRSACRRCWISSRCCSIRPPTATHSTR